MYLNNLVSSITLVCPSSTYIFEIYNCTLTAVSNGANYFINVDYGDGFSANYSLTDNSISIHKVYYNSGNYTINARVLNGYLNVNPIVQGEYK